MGATARMKKSTTGGAAQDGAGVRARNSQAGLPSPEHAHTGSVYRRLDRRRSPTGCPLDPMASGGRGDVLHRSYRLPC
jgi:hypothetical protein